MGLYTCNRNTYGRGENGMKYAYIRVSTTDQNETRQIVAMEKHEIPASNYFVEKISAKNTDRPELQRLLSTVQTGDTIYIHDFSRLSRSTADLLQIVENLTARGIHLVSNKENLDTSTPTGKLMLTMIGAIYEFERTNMLERQREGIAVAKAAGTYKGGKRKEVNMDLFKSLLADFRANRITKNTMAYDLGVSRPTLNRLLADFA